MHLATDRISRGSATRGDEEIASVADLVGAPPEALAELYARGRPPIADELAGDRHGRFLAPDPAAREDPLARTLAALSRAVEVTALPWRGKRFDETGTRGENRLFGLHVFPFHASIELSRLDGELALVLRYDALGNPWPVSRVVDELRAIAPGVAIGPAFLARDRVVRWLWWGIDLRRP